MCMRLCLEWYSASIVNHKWKLAFFFVFLLKAESVYIFKVTIRVKSFLKCNCRPQLKQTSLVQPWILRNNKHFRNKQTLKKAIRIAHISLYINSVTAEAFLHWTVFDFLHYRSVSIWKRPPPRWLLSTDLFNNKLPWESGFFFSWQHV